MSALTKTYLEPAILLGSYELLVTEYEANEAGQAAAAERLASELMKASHASIITGEFGIFDIPNFVRVLQSAARLGRPSIDIVFHCDCLIKARTNHRPVLKSDARRLLLDELRQRWPEKGRDGISRSDAAAAVESALEAGVLHLHVVDERVEDRPHSTIFDNGSLGIQQVHRRGVHSKAWFIENPAGLIREYEKDHDTLRQMAAIIT